VLLFKSLNIGSVQDDVDDDISSHLYEKYSCPAQSVRGRLIKLFKNYSRHRILLLGVGVIEECQGVGLWPWTKLKGTLARDF
jgi:hypothetical protein